MNKKIAIIILKTISIFDKQGVVVEVGIVSLDLSTGEIVHEFGSVVKADNFNESYKKSSSFKSSTLTFENINSAPSFDKKILEITHAVNKPEIIGVTGFDTDFDFLRESGVIINAPIVACIRKEAQSIIKTPSKRRGGFKKPSLMEAFQYFFKDKKYVCEHRASKDAEDVALIAYEMYKKTNKPEAVSSFTKQIVGLSMKSEQEFVQGLSIYMSSREGDMKVVISDALNGEIMDALEDPLVKIDKCTEVGFALFFNKCSAQQAIKIFYTLKEIETKKDSCIIKNVITVLSENGNNNIGYSRLVFIKNCDKWKVLIKETLPQIFNTENDLVKKSLQETILNQ